MLVKGRYKGKNVFCVDSTDLTSTSNCCDVAEKITGASSSDRLMHDFYWRYKCLGEGKCLNADFVARRPKQKCNAKHFPSLDKQGWGAFKKDTPTD